MRITNQSVAVAAGDEQKKQQRALDLGRQIVRVIDGVHRAYSLLMQRNVSLLSLATGSWRTEVEIDFAGVEQALKEARKLVDLIGRNSTIEYECSDLGAGSLLERVEGTLALIEPLRAELTPKKVWS